MRALGEERTRGTAPSVGLTTIEFKVPSHRVTASATERGFRPALAWGELLRHSDEISRFELRPPRSESGRRYRLARLEAEAGGPACRARRSASGSRRRRWWSWDILRTLVAKFTKKPAAGAAFPSSGRSGGSAIVAGPGCLMYALVLSYELRPALRSLDAAHQPGRWERWPAAALATLVAGVLPSGICDLTYRDRKFSGNAVRCRRTHMLYHGTVLYDFDLELVEACLAMPSRACPTTAAAAIIAGLRHQPAGCAPIADRRRLSVRRGVLKELQRHHRVSWSSS